MRHFCHAFSDCAQFGEEPFLRVLLPRLALGLGLKVSLFEFAAAKWPGDNPFAEEFLCQVAAQRGGEEDVAQWLAAVERVSGSSAFYEMLCAADGDGDTALHILASQCASRGASPQPVMDCVRGLVPLASVNALLVRRNGEGHVPLMEFVNCCARVDCLTEECLSALVPVRSRASLVFATLDLFWLDHCRELVHFVASKCGRLSAPTGPPLASVSALCGARVAAELLRVRSDYGSPLTWYVSRVAAEWALTEAQLAPLVPVGGDAHAFWTAQCCHSDGKTVLCECVSRCAECGWSVAPVVATLRALCGDALLNELLCTKYMRKHIPLVQYAGQATGALAVADLAALVPTGMSAAEEAMFWMKDCADAVADDALALVYAELAAAGPVTMAAVVDKVAELSHFGTHVLPTDWLLAHTLRHAISSVPVDADILVRPSQFASMQFDAASYDITEDEEEEEEDDDGVV